MKAQAAWLLVVGVLVGAATVQALTAFGKSGNSDKDKAPTPKVPKARPCVSNGDCAGTASTTCMLDKTSGKRYCLCRDNLPPINSKCAVIPTAPGKSCAENSECVINAECIVTNNETRKKACACKEGYSYDSNIDDSMCNGCGAVWPCVVTLLVTLMVLLGSETLAGTAAT